MNEIWNIIEIFPAWVFILIAIMLLCIIVRFAHTDDMIKKNPRQGIWGYFVCYADQRSKNDDFGKILYSERFDLQGKPDYIFQSYLGRKMVPVEIKSGAVRESLYPHDGDRLQLAVYFLIIEDVYGIKPKKGRLIYSDAMFIIKNTKKIRKEAAETVVSMRRMLNDGVGEARASFVHCRYCLCRGTVCEYCEKI